MDTQNLESVLQALKIWKAGIESVLGDRLIESNVLCDGKTLSILHQRFDLSNSQSIVIVGAGKATLAMCKGLVNLLEQRSSKLITGWINVPETATISQNDFPVHVHIARPLGVNEPTRAAEVGAMKIYDLVSHCCEADTVICLLSGGGSALLPLPKPGISLDDKLRVTQFLSAAGCSIQELNAVRRCLSRVKAGGLARACNASRLITLILSDVLGDPIEFISSGPTELLHPPDYELAMNVIDRTDPQHSHIPNSVRELIASEQEKKSTVAQRSKSEVHNIILGNNATAVNAAARKAIDLGLRCESFSSLQAEGDVGMVGQQIAAKIINGSTTRGQYCLILGGEPTVKLPSPSNRGIGGRNQQLALCVLKEIIARRSELGEREFAFLSAGSDGEDGPTRAAGAWIDSQLVMKMSNQVDLIDAYIKRCDAYTFFEQHNRLFVTGPTGTNVCDIRVAVVK